MGQIKTEIDRAKQLTVNTVSGSPTADDYLIAIKKVLDDNPTEYIIWDYTDADISGLSSQDLEDMMRFTVSHPNSHKRKKMALILPVDVSYGLGRMFEAFGDMNNISCQIKPFRSAEEAFDWLGIDNIRE